MIPLTVGAVIALGLAASAQVSAAAPADGAENMEKCYGVAKKGMNDCSTPQYSCAAHSPKDNDADTWIIVPPGTCNKIVGGTVK